MRTCIPAMLIYNTIWFDFCHRKQIDAVAARSDDVTRWLNELRKDPEKSAQTIASYSSAVSGL